MTRTKQPAGTLGSLKWIQRGVEGRWASLEEPILQQVVGSQIEWRSPLKSDGYAEYRDGDFLDIVGLPHLRSALASFWPSRGPQWDALGVTNRDEVLLVEAKAHVGEICSSPTGAGEVSRRLIAESLANCAARLGARAGHATWTEHFYQLANRLAHLQFLRDQNVSAFLVLVNFIDDAEMKGPSSPEVWEAAYQVAFHVMGLGERHPLSRYIIHAYPSVRTSEKK